MPRVHLGFAAALVPWAVHLASTLPRTSVSAHHRSSWVGYDLALVAVLAAVGWLAHRRSPRVVLAARAGATMLVAGAWFDVTTSAPGTPHVEALLFAVLLELPTAALSAALARRALTTVVATHPEGASLRGRGRG